MVYALIGIPLCLVTLASLGRMLTRVIKFAWRFVRRFYHTGRCCPANRTVKVFEGRPNSSVSRQHTQVEKPRNSWRMSCMHCWRWLTCRKNKLDQDPEHFFGNDLDVPGDDDIGSYVSLVDDDVDEFNVPPAVAIFVTVLYIAGGTAMYPFWESWGYMDSFYFIFVSISTIGFGDVLPEHPRYFLASSLYILFGLALVAMVINVIMVVVLETITKAKDTMQKAADHLDKAADKAKEAMMDVGQKMGIEISSGSSSSSSSSSSIEKKAQRCSISPQMPLNKPLRNLGYASSDRRSRSTIIQTITAAIRIAVLATDF
ncbi:hypothetical protein CAPTEDRAFT_211278 [Capitella teleta]|uniref:Potassium channel domain-containing protein n=1 Tax=Capitella teleta TaxID=283909 RepID=R7TIB7_CAPTE|nr:hypothetical protein CAPTEDRAFT_211278 [Capitella teleta]|eukprot:ELT93588.1 hypothetical protein CAPTEDRAFT_211278 [Capitella teleta]